MNPKIVGRICANEHPRVVYYDALCPVCSWITIALAGKQRVDKLEKELSQAKAK